MRLARLVWQTGGGDRAVRWMPASSAGTQTTWRCATQSEVAWGVAVKRADRDRRKPVGPLGVLDHRRRSLVGVESSNRWASWRRKQSAA